MKSSYTSMKDAFTFNRRSFMKISGAIGGGLLLGNPTAWAEENARKEPPATNVNDVLEVARKKHSLPGYAPGKVVEIHDHDVITDKIVNPDIVVKMLEKSITTLTGMDMKKSFAELFNVDDIVGIKVNPVGPRVISVHLELVDAVIDWLEKNGVARKNIIIWDRFDYMLTDGGFTKERYPGIGIVGLQTMDESAYMGEAEDDSGWLDENGVHLSMNNFDQSTYYWADVEGPKEKPYLNQHVVNGKYSYFGKLLTQKLTKIINIAAFKNTGNGISMATKNMGYGSICNTGRLHRPLFFNVCTEVLAFPCIRDKMVLNITDALVGQYDGGPMGDAKFTYEKKSIFAATDPFALDMICHNQMVQKRKEMGVRVNEHPRYTEYLRYAEKLGLGIANPENIDYVKI